MERLLIFGWNTSLIQIVGYWQIHSFTHLVIHSCFNGLPVMLICYVSFSLFTVIFAFSTLVPLRLQPHAQPFHVIFFFLKPGGRPKLQIPILREVLWSEYNMQAVITWLNWDHSFSNFLLYLNWQNCIFF